MPFTTRVVFNILTNEKGEPVAGEIVKATIISPKLSRSNQAEEIPITVTTITDQNGRWELALIPNDQLDDPLSYYQIQEGSDGKPWTHWHAIRVPSGDTPVWLGDVIIPDIPSSPQTVGILNNLVSSLRADNNVPLKGDVQLASGTGIQLSQDYNNRKITISATGGGGGGGSHNLLDGSVHPDSSATIVQRGMLIVGQLISGVIKWAGLVLGAAGKVLKSNGTDVVWGDVEWNEIANKPTSFTPEVHGRTKHTHALLPNTAPTIPTEGDIWYDSATGQKKLRYRDDIAVRTVNDWNDLFNKPSTFPPSPHTHSLGEITQSGASTNQVPKWSGSSWVAGNVDWNEVTNKPTTFPPSAHNHVPSDISPQGHNSGLNADMVDGDHASAFERITNKGVPGGYASLDSNGKVVQDPANATATPAPNKIPIAGSDGKLATGWLSDNLRTVSVGITVGDGVNPITTGVKGAIWIPISGTITEWTILSTDGATPTTGSIEFDILKSTYSNYPTMTSIVGSGIKPNITNSNKGNGTPTGWSTTQINAGDCLRFDVTSVTSLKRVTLVLKVVKS